MSPLFFRQNTLPVWERSYWTIPQSKNLKEKVPAFSHILFLFFLLQCLLFSYEMCKKKFDKKIYKTKRSITVHIWQFLILRSMTLCSVFVTKEADFLCIVDNIFHEQQNCDIKHAFPLIISLRDGLHTSDTLL